MREKLTITEVLEPRTIGEKNIPLQEFMADGKKYSVFGETLPPYIKLNAEIDAEVDIKKGPTGTTWTNYKVTDIYLDGKSVKAQKQGFNRGKSPEELELSRRSYALAYAKDLAVAGLIPIKDIPNKATEFYNWMQVTATAPTSDVINDIMKKAIDLEPPEPITAGQKGRLKELQEKLPGRMKELTTKWVWGITTVSKLTKPQAEHMIEELEKELSLLYPKAGE